MKLERSFPALITPFRGGQVDLVALAHLVDWHACEGSAGLVVCGTTGESPTLSPAEQHSIIATSVDAAKGRMPIVAGASSNHTAHAIELTALARDAGADAAMHTTGFYNKPSQRQVVEHYRQLDAASQLPLIVYNVPSRTGVDVSVDSLAEIACLPKVVGVKDATGDVSRVTRERRLIDKPFAFFSGDDSTALGYMAHGGAGCISVTANVLPRAYAKFMQLCQDSAFEEARAMHARMMALHLALFFEPSPGGVKYALSKMRMCEESLRAPLSAISEIARAEVDDALDAFFRAEQACGAKAAAGGAAQDALPREMAGCA
jgi:4-hydroxy-tetrahydrodipicolinate synthase